MKKSGSLQVALLSIIEQSERIQKAIGWRKHKILKLGMIQNMQILLPPLAEQRAIVEQLESLSAETGRLEEIYQLKVRGMEELKKSLLQRAFAGEL